MQLGLCPQNVMLLISSQHFYSMYQNSFDNFFASISISFIHSLVKQPRSLKKFELFIDKSDMNFVGFDSRIKRKI